MLRRSLRRRRSRSRSRPEIEVNSIEHVISVWKNAAFQREHGENEEKIKKLINKLKKQEKETKPLNTRKVGNSTQRKLPSTSATEESKHQKKSSGSEEIKEHSGHEMTIGKMSVIKRHKYNTM